MMRLEEQLVELYEQEKAALPEHKLFQEQKEALQRKLEEVEQRYSALDGAIKGYQAQREQLIQETLDSLSKQLDARDALYQEAKDGLLFEKQQTDREFIKLYEENDEETKIHTDEVKALLKPEYDEARQHEEKRKAFEKILDCIIIVSRHEGALRFLCPITEEQYKKKESLMEALAAGVASYLITQQSPVMAGGSVDTKYRDGFLEVSVRGMRTSPSKKLHLPEELVKANVQARLIDLDEIMKGTMLFHEHWAKKAAEEGELREGEKAKIQETEAGSVPSEKEDAYLTVKQAGRYFADAVRAHGKAYSASTIEKGVVLRWAIKNGALKTESIEGRTGVAKADLERYIEKYILHDVAGAQKKPEKRGIAVQRVEEAPRYEILEEGTKVTHYTRNEVAAILNESSSNILYWIRENELPAEKKPAPVGGRGFMYLIPRTSIDKFCSRRGIVPDYAKGGQMNNEAHITHSVKEKPYKNKEKQDAAEYYTAKQAAKRLKTAESNVRFWIKSGKLDVQMVRGSSPTGKIYQISGEALDTFLKEREISDKKVN